MQLGAVFPQTEIGQDPAVIRAYAEAVEQLGYEHLLAFDHVLGADTATRPDWRGPYTSKTMFHEPMVLFGYLAAVTRRIELVTGIIILPQRQTALVAKQAAEIDVLSGGRLRLGVGLGWNDVEYEALGENFRNRGRRVEEQVEVMRALWAQEVVTYEGRWHRITAAGINPLPLKRSIPLWFGGGRNDTALRRIARLADGWLAQVPPNDEGTETIERWRTFAREAGRDPATLGLELRLSAADGLETVMEQAEFWRQQGVTHLEVNTMRAGYGSLDEHLDALRTIKEALASSQALST